MRHASHSLKLSCLAALLLLQACGGGGGSDSTVTAPGAPTLQSATSGNAWTLLTFSAPADNGGSAITSYKATCLAGTASQSASSSSSPLTVTGLTNGTTYSCSVTATNSIGTSASSGSVSVTPTGSSSTTPTLPTPALGAINFSSNFFVSQLTCGKAISSTYSNGSLYSANWYDSDCTGGAISSLSLGAGATYPYLILSYGNATFGSCAYNSTFNDKKLTVTVDNTNRIATFFDNTLNLYASVAGINGQNPSCPLSISIYGKLAY